jgi:hypothetical protein
MGRTPRPRRIGVPRGPRRNSFQTNREKRSGIAEAVARLDVGLSPLRPYRLRLPAFAATVEMGLLHYSHFRPHQGLGGATPAEMYFGSTPAHLSAIPPPRGRPTEGRTDSPFRVDYLDAERLLPVLVQRAA